jgi:hypothetical protein
MPSKRKHGVAAFTSGLDPQDDVWTLTMGVPDDRAGSALIARDVDMSQSRSGSTLDIS